MYNSELYGKAKILRILKDLCIEHIIDTNRIYTHKQQFTSFCVERGEWILIDHVPKGVLLSVDEL